MKRIPLLIALGLVWPPTSFGQPLRFSDYPMDRVYSGNTVLPQFKGRDKAWRKFRTVITEGMAECVDYAGDISVIQIGCGTGCSLVVLGNVKTGRLYDFPRGAENSTHLQLYTQPTSRLLAAQWEDGQTCHLEYYLWTGKGVKRLKDTTLPATDDCMKDIAANLR